MTKRLLTLLLTITLLTPIANAADVFTYNGLKFDITGSSTVLVSKNQNASGSVVIPEVAHNIYYTYDSNGNPIKHDYAYTVTAIGEYAFWLCSGLTNVTIPNSVTSIGNYAFVGCVGLTSVAIPNSVTSIGERAFYSCSGLTGTLTIPNSVTTIDSYAFHGCTGLTNINIPNSVTSIGAAAFASCIGLTNINIPNSVTEIGRYAFASCNGLTGITIPNSVTTIGGSAFQNCSSLTSITIPNSVTSLEESLFWNCISLTSVKIPDSIHSIGGYVFYNCQNLYSISIPNSVTEIGEGAFYGCSNLRSAIIPNSVSIIENCIFADCINLTSVNIPNSITSIGRAAFYGCSNLESVIIPKSIISIDDMAFFGCAGLTSIKVENGNTVYDSRNNCNAIIETKTNTLITGCKNTVIPNSVTLIGEDAFSGCSGLTSVNIPSSVTTIGDYAFYGCSGLKNIYSQIQHPENVALGSIVFLDVVMDVCTLHVPRGTVPVYRRCEQWKDFLNIVDDVEGTTTIVIPATALELNPKHLVLHPGESADITAVFTPQYPTVTLLDWATDDEEVATVNGKGHVTALNTGRVTISATTIDLSDITATCTLHVVPEGASVVHGDVDGSGMVDVDDVNAMINLILFYDQYKDKYPGSADLDGNGVVDVEDMNAIINIILAQ